MATSHAQKQRVHACALLFLSPPCVHSFSEAVGDNHKGCERVSPLSAAKSIEDESDQDRSSKIDIDESDATQCTHHLEKHGYVHLKNWRFFGEDDLAGAEVSVWMYARNTQD